MLRQGKELTRPGATELVQHVLSDDWRGKGRGDGTSRDLELDDCVQMT